MEKDRYYEYLKSKKDDTISSMQKYVEQKQEIDKFLERLLEPCFSKYDDLKVLDVCCGNGHLIYHLSKLLKNGKFVGIDYSEYLIDEAKRINVENINSEFLCMDFNDLDNRYKKEFDISISWKTASWQRAVQKRHYKDCCGS